MSGINRICCAHNLCQHPGSSRRRPLRQDHGSQRLGDRLRAVHGVLTVSRLAGWLTMSAIGAIAVAGALLSFVRPTALPPQALHWSGARIQSYGGLIECGSRGCMPEWVRICVASIQNCLLVFTRPLHPERVTVCRGYGGEYAFCHANRRLTERLNEWRRWLRKCLCVAFPSPLRVLYAFGRRARASARVANVVRLAWASLRAPSLTWPHSRELADSEQLGTMNRGGLLRALSNRYV